MATTEPQVIMLDLDPNGNMMEQMAAIWRKWVQDEQRTTCGRARSAGASLRSD